MWKPSKSLVCGLGAVVMGHYVVAGSDNPPTSDDQLQPPPLASITVITSSATVNSLSVTFPAVVNAITDEPHDVSQPAGSLIPLFSLQ
jgi:hypothetical protein